MQFSSSYTTHVHAHLRRVVGMLCCYYCSYGISATFTSAEQLGCSHDQVSPWVRLDRFTQLANLEGEPAGTLNRENSSFPSLSPDPFHTQFHSLSLLILFLIIATICDWRHCKKFPSATSLITTLVCPQWSCQTHVASSKGSVQEGSKKTVNTSLKFLVPNMHWDMWHNSLCIWPRPNSPRSPPLFALLQSLSLEASSANPASPDTREARNSAQQVQERWTAASHIPLDVVQCSPIYREPH